MRLIQLRHAGQGRRVAEVRDSQLVLLDRAASIYDLARAALAAKTPMIAFVEKARSKETLEYDAVYRGASEWKILPAFDHPTEPARCHVTGTGLTHINSAKHRDAMHAKTNAGAAPITDSMRMFQWGIEGGKPAAGAIGTQPEWFYKGNGHVLRGANEPLDVPAFADDGGEEPELVGCYVIDDAGNPRRVGMCVGNEFSDHQMEKKNYLYLAPCKLRTCSLGPELVIDFDFADVKGRVAVERAGKTLWEKEVASGEANMCHSLANLEHHQFKYPHHRIAGDAHVHFWGADAFSFGSGVTLQDGDVMSVEWRGYGRPLRNPIRIDRSKPKLVAPAPV